MRLLRTYPTEQNMTRRFFSEKMAFLCRSCRNAIESSYRVESLDGVICSSCLDKKLKGIPIVQYRDTEPTPNVRLRRKR